MMIMILKRISGEAEITVCDAISMEMRRYIAYSVALVV